MKPSKYKNKQKSHEHYEDTAQEEMRLNKYLAHAGVASRRKADELIEKGLVKVNGKVVKEVGIKIQKGDKIEFEGQELKPEKKVYVLLNKPKNVLTTTQDDKERKTVMDLLKGVKEKVKSRTDLRLYPVGRLDRNTTGVLLITNDGDLSKKLTHPSSEVAKVYKVTLNKDFTENDFSALLKGTELEDGFIKVDALAFSYPDDKRILGVEIHSGKNRIVRRLFEHYGYEVVYLDRMLFAGLTKKDVPRGKWRLLNDVEVRQLKQMNAKKGK